MSTWLVSFDWAMDTFRILENEWTMIVRVWCVSIKVFAEFSGSPLLTMCSAYKISLDVEWTNSIAQLKSNAFRLFGTLFCLFLSNGDKDKWWPLWEMCNESDLEYVRKCTGKHSFHTFISRLIDVVQYLDWTLFHHSNGSFDLQYRKVWDFMLWWSLDFVTDSFFIYTDGSYSSSLYLDIHLYIQRVLYYCFLSRSICEHRWSFPHHWIWSMINKISLRDQRMVSLVLFLELIGEIDQWSCDVIFTMGKNDID